MKLRTVFLAISLIFFCVRVFADTSTNMSDSFPSLTLSSVASILATQGYDNVQMIKKNSPDAYAVQASKNGAEAELFLLTTNGSINIINQKMGIISSHWSPEDVQNATNAFITVVHHAPIYFGVDNNNKATLSDAPNKAARTGEIWNYNKETNVLTKAF
jgi:hypothetical protein